MRRLTFAQRFVLLTALMHLYIGVRLTPDVLTHPGWHWGGWLAVALSFAAILGGFASGRARTVRPGAVMSWIGFLALGLFSSVLVLTILRDVLLLVLTGLGLALPEVRAAMASGEVSQATALAVPILALAATVAGLINARRLARVVTVDVALEGLPPDLAGYTIVQISDLHVGPTIRRPTVEAVVNAVNALTPDLIVLTGDIVDGGVPQLANHTSPLGRLTARDGVYAVTGNHEYYAGANAWIAEWRRLGMQVLLNEHVVIGEGANRFVLAGVTDYSARAFDPAHYSDPVGALAQAPADVPTRILLAHQPRSAPAARDAGFQLQLSGHTHGGQFLPWRWFVRLQQPFTAGLHRLGNLQVYVSRGTGYWGPPNRLGAPSEITRIRLMPAVSVGTGG